MKNFTQQQQQRFNKSDKLRMLHNSMGLLLNCVKTLIVDRDVNDQKLNIKE